MEPSRAVALLNMPFQALGPAALTPYRRRARLRGADLSAQVHDLNLAFARTIGRGAHWELTDTARLADIAEWLFAPYAGGDLHRGDDHAFFARVAADLERLRLLGDPRRWLLRVRADVVPAFLADACQRIAAGGPPGVVVITCPAAQTSAALALGRRLRQRHPQVRLVLEGPGVRGDVGVALLQAAPLIDGVVLGDDDLRLIELLRALHAPAASPGLVGALLRRGDEVHGSPPGAASVPPPTTAPRAAEASPSPSCDASVDDPQVHRDMSG